MARPVFSSLFSPTALMGAAGALLLSSCNYFSATPVWEDKDRELSRKDFSGRYAVKSLSWFVKDRGNMKKASVVLHGNGKYSVISRKPSSNHELLPSPSGTWVVEPRRGMDLGSRETWSVRFEGSDGSRAFAWSLDYKAPYRLMFVDLSRVEVGETLILKRVGPANE